MSSHRDQFHRDHGRNPSHSTRDQDSSHGYESRRSVDVRDQELYRPRKLSNDHQDQETRDNGRRPRVHDTRSQANTAYSDRSSQRNRTYEAPSNDSRSQTAVPQSSRSNPVHDHSRRPSGDTRDQSSTSSSHRPSQRERAYETPSNNSRSQTTVAPSSRPDTGYNLRSRPSGDARNQEATTSSSRPPMNDRGPKSAAPSQDSAITKTPSRIPLPRRDYDVGSSSGTRQQTRGHDTTGHDTTPSSRISQRSQGQGTVSLPFRPAQRNSGNDIASPEQNQDQGPSPRDGNPEAQRTQSQQKALYFMDNKTAKALYDAIASESLESTVDAFWSYALGRYFTYQKGFSVMPQSQPNYPQDRTRADLTVKSPIVWFVEESDDTWSSQGSQGERFMTVMILESKRRKGETQNAVWGKATKQLETYLNSTVSNEYGNDKPTSPLYGAVAVGRFVRFHLLNPGHKLMQRLEVPGVVPLPGNQPFELKRDTEQIHQILEWLVSQSSRNMEDLRERWAANDSLAK